MPSVNDFYSPPHTGLAFGVVNANHPYGHSGQDYNGWSQGTIIPSPVIGTVVRRIISTNDLGNVVVVQTAIGWFSFCHLRDFVGAPTIGSAVGIGSPLGPIGNTGYSFGTHLHAMFSRTSDNPVTRIGIEDPKPVIDAARQTTAGGGTTPFPPTPEPETDYDMPLILKATARGNWLIGPGFAHHISSIDQDTQLGQLGYPVKDCGAVTAAFDLIWTGHTNLPAFQDVNVGGGVVTGGLTAAQNTMLMTTLPAAVDGVPTTGELGQALTSTAILVNQHADANKDIILDAIGDIPAGAGGNFALSLDIDNVPGTATGTATPTLT